MFSALDSLNCVKILLDCGGLLFSCRDRSERICDRGLRLRDLLTTVSRKLLDLVIYKGLPGWLNHMGRKLRDLLNHEGRELGEFSNDQFQKLLIYNEQHHSGFPERLTAQILLAKVELTREIVSSFETLEELEVLTNASTNEVKLEPCRHGISQKLSDNMTMQFSKFKRGLSGFANGNRISAFPDTGSIRNVVSEAYANQMKLEIQGSPRDFILGNSKKTQSLGELFVFSRVGGM